MLDGDCWRDRVEREELVFFNAGVCRTWAVLGILEGLLQEVKECCVYVELFVLPIAEAAGQIPAEFSLVLVAKRLLDQGAEAVGSCKLNGTLAGQEVQCVFFEEVEGTPQIK